MIAVQTLAQVIESARDNLGGVMLSSARLCLENAETLRDSGDRTAARERAVQSLKYSVGIFHPAYQAAAAK